MLWTGKSSDPIAGSSGEYQEESRSSAAMKADLSVGAVFLFIK